MSDPQESCPRRGAQMPIRSNCGHRIVQHHLKRPTRNQEKLMSSDRAPSLLKLAPNQSGVLLVHMEKEAARGSQWLTSGLHAIITYTKIGCHIPICNLRGLACLRYCCNISVLNLVGMPATDIIMGSPQSQAGHVRFYLWIKS